MKYEIVGPDEESTEKTRKVRLALVHGEPSMQMFGDDGTWWNIVSVNEGRAHRCGGISDSDFPELRIKDGRITDAG